MYRNYPVNEEKIERDITLASIIIKGTNSYSLLTTIVDSNDHTDLHLMVLNTNLKCHYQH